MTEREPERDPTFMVFEFHHKFGLSIAAPWNDLKVWQRRMGLIMEEYKELFQDWRDLRELLEKGEDPPDELIANILKELCDVLYVVRGAGIDFGLPMPQAFAAVHESNMSKTGKISDGKLGKGTGYRPPDIRGLLKGTAGNEAPVRIPKDDDVNGGAGTDPAGD